MSTAIESRMVSKIFIGYNLNPELKILLSKSPQWKQAKIVQNDPLSGLTETHFHEKEYIGRFLLHETMTIFELKTIANEIQGILKEHCPKYPVENLQTYVFSQIFIS